MNRKLLLPFLTSLGALLYEFSLAQFLGMALGNATFAFSYAVGVFLLAMGYGSFKSSGRTATKEPAADLLKIEATLALLCFITLPVLVEASSFFRFYTLGLSGCRSLVCSNAGIGLLVVATFLLFLVGAAVGKELPLFFTVLRLDQAQILAADYIGAFAAGLLFPLFLLPALGLWGVLSLAALLHWLVSLWVLIRFRKGAVKKRLWVVAVQILIAVGILLQLVFSNQAESFLMRRLTSYLYPVPTEILESFRTRKQQVLLSRAKVGGSDDVRLYLDGYLQFSSQWNTEAYHRSMALVARRELGPMNEARKVLVLGGGDGLLADTLVRNFPQDRVKVVDFDCELVQAFSHRPALRALSEKAWDSPNVQFVCEDAFHYVLRPEDRGQWDLVLVDFPHGVGDAASLKVETWEFFRDLRAVLRPESGRVVLHHEQYRSEERECVERTLGEAGFSTTSFPAEEGLEAEAMIIGRIAPEPAQVNYSAIQNSFRPRCVSALKRFGRIWLGS
jgi:spermidine synthase